MTACLLGRQPRRALVRAAAACRCVTRITPTPPTAAHAAADKCVGGHDHNPAARRTHSEGPGRRVVWSAGMQHAASPKAVLSRLWLQGSTGQKTGPQPAMVYLVARVIGGRGTQQWNQAAAPPLGRAPFLGLRQRVPAMDKRSAAPRASPVHGLRVVGLEVLDCRGKHRVDLLHGLLKVGARGAHSLRRRDLACSNVARCGWWEEHTLVGVLVSVLPPLHCKLCTRPRAVVPPPCMSCGCAATDGAAAGPAAA